MEINNENIDTILDKDGDLEMNDNEEMNKNAKEVQTADVVEDVATDASPKETSEDITVIGCSVAKIADELKNFKGGVKETAVSKFVASTLTKFCEENERFAEVVCKTPRTLSDCCAEVMDGCGNAISDIDVYRGAVRSYFPNADIRFLMEITITGSAPSPEEINRKPRKKLQEPHLTRKGKSKQEKKKETIKPPKDTTVTNTKSFDVSEITKNQSYAGSAVANAKLTPDSTIPKAKQKIETLQLTLF